MSREHFFYIPCAFDLYAEPLTGPASESLLLAKMPKTFKLLRDIAEKEQTALSHINQIPKGDIISDYLKLQAKKVDLVLHQQLAQIDFKGTKGQGTHLGGSHLSFDISTQFISHPDQELALNLLVKQYNLAIYCFGKVVETSTSQNIQSIQVEIIEIGEAEQELLIRASLQQQQSILKSRKQH